MDVRINKYLSENGICSRREADRRIEEGRVTINGVKAVMGSKVLPGDRVAIDGKVLKDKPEPVYIAFNKPRGVVCTTDLREPDNIIDFIGYEERIFPIGRLDKFSEGLILLTNDGDIVNKMLRSVNNHEKEYVVTLNRPYENDFIRRMAGGLPVLDRITKRCKVTPVNDQTFRIILTEGLNRQIRRMVEYLGYHAVRLKRIRIMNINLGDLPPGYWRDLSEEELGELMRLTEYSRKTRGHEPLIEDCE